MKEILEQELKQIEVPQELHERCMAGVRQAVLVRQRRRLMKAASAAAALLICCMLAANPVVSQTLRGVFGNLTDRQGAVTGTSYTCAAGEIEVRILSAEQAEDETILEVEIAFLFPEEVPWRELEEISLGVYRVTDGAGKVLCKATGTQETRFSIEDGKVCFSLRMGSQLPEQGGYSLEIDRLYGHKKADAPLEITFS